MMSKKYRLKLLSLALFISLSGISFGQKPNCSTVGNSVGLNYQFYNDATPSKLDGIARRWRQFTAWHNLGYDSHTYLDPVDMIRKPCPNPVIYDDNDPNNFMPTWRYFPDNNFMGERNRVNMAIQNLISEGKADFAYPAMTNSHHFLSTERFFNGGTWVDGDVDNADAGWRKPVPFVKDGGGLILAPGESFTDQNSYRFYSDFLSYYLGVFGSQPMSPLLKKNQSEFEALGWTNHFEIWNEPTAHWTKPNDYGYFTPLELAVMTASVLNGASLDQCTDDSEECIVTPDPACNYGVTVGLSADPNLTVISPAPHEMDVNYYISYMNELRNIVGDDFNFDINAFHHYSAYRASELTTGITPDEIVERSVLMNDQAIPFDLNSSNELYTVNLEAAPYSNSAYWICPELDGYKERGSAVKGALEGANITGEIWVTEWGYSTLQDDDAALYPKDYQDFREEAQARWLIRGFMEYGQSVVGSSFWHWYQDGSGGQWDTEAGIIGPGGARKPAWYYLHTMMNEIGNLAPDGQFKLNTCDDIDYVPSVVVDGDNLEGENPMVTCPRIYKYVDDSSCENDCQEINDAV